MNPPLSRRTSGPSRTVRPLLTGFAVASMPDAARGRLAAAYHGHRGGNTTGTGGPRSIAVTDDVLVHYKGTQSLQLSDYIDLTLNACCYTALIP